MLRQTPASVARGKDLVVYVKNIAFARNLNKTGAERFKTNTETVPRYRERRGFYEILF
jgi:hypothetical protein